MIINLLWFLNELTSFQAIFVGFKAYSSLQFKKKKPEDQTYGGRSGEIRAIMETSIKNGRSKVGNFVPVYYVIHPSLQVIALILIFRNIRDGG